MDKQTMIKTTCTAAIAALALTTSAQAQDVTIAEDKIIVLACLEAMEQTTTWPQCVQLMFKPCEAEVIASEAHATCLTAVRTEWADTVQILQDDVIGAVSPKGKTEVLELMGQWTNYVVQKCTEVAAAKETGAESARLGCEVSEIAGLAGEFAACLEGRSSAEYCEIKN